MGLKARELEPSKENLISTLKKDLLERNESILRFARFCDAQEGKCSIAIDAGWGFGKTFFVKQTKLVLEAHNPYAKTLSEEEREEIHKAFVLSHGRSDADIDLGPEVCVYYDAWANDNDVDPILSLIYEIIKDTACDYEFKKSADCLKTVSLIADFFSGKNATDFLEFLRGRDPLSVIKDQRDIHTLVSDFLESLLFEQGNRLVVFIDELDRCKPSYAVQLLERIKHYFSNDRITFVFSINIDELQHTIKRHYGEGFDACRYLDRFFDYRLSLPVANMTRYYSELGLENGNFVYESICKAVIEKYSFGLRETEKFYRMARIAAYKPTHKIGYSGFSDGNALQFGLCIGVPIAIGLKMTDSKLFNDFISGKNALPLQEVLGDGEIARGYCSTLLDGSESYFEASPGKTKCVTLSEKIEEAYDALFGDRKRDKYGETVVGQCSFSRDTKEKVLNAISLLSEFSTYE